MLEYSGGKDRQGCEELRPGPLSHAAWMRDHSGALLLLIFFFFFSYGSEPRAPWILYITLLHSP